MICLVVRCSLTASGYRAATMETNGVNRGLHSVLDQTSKEEQSLKVKLTSKGQATGLKDWVHEASDWCLESGFQGSINKYA